MASLLAVPALPVATSAGNIACFVGKADTTYRVLPRKDKVSVSVDYVSTNRCRDYRLIGWRFGWIPLTAERVRFRGPGLSAERAERDGQWRSYDVTFPAVDPGRSYRWKITYDLPAGRSKMWNELVLDDDYEHLCWIGHGADTGITRLILPRRSRPLTYVGSTRTQRGRKHVTVSATRQSKPHAQVLCTDVYFAGKLTKQRVVSPGGTKVIVEGFADDPSWSERVRAQVATTIPRLEEVFGSPAAKRGQITIREVPEQYLGGYAGHHYPGGHIRLGDTADVSTIVAHEVAHQWSDSHNFVDTWVQEGIADWVANEVVPLRSGDYCFEPRAYPGKGEPRLSRWLSPGPREAERKSDLVDYQYDAACHIFTRLGTVMGDERMIEVIRALVDGRPPYGGSPRPPKQRRQPADWREWLDAVDEIGLVPAGVEDMREAEAFVTEFGIAGQKALAGRAEARLRYHHLLSRQPGVAAPLILRDQMDAWRFKEAHATMRIAESLGPKIAAAVAAADSLTAEQSGQVAKLQRRYEGATTRKGLRRLRADVHSLSIPASDPGLTTTGDDAFTDG
jgi:hypothetical protein